MTNLERIHYLIRTGEADAAATWARKLASDAFSNNYSLRVYANRPHLSLVVGNRTCIFAKG